VKTKLYLPAVLAAALALAALIAEGTIWP